jgi:hypothetical protein
MCPQEPEHLGENGSAASVVPEKYGDPENDLPRPKNSAIEMQAAPLQGHHSTTVQL